MTFLGSLLNSPDDQRRLSPGWLDLKYLLWEFLHLLGYSLPYLMYDGFTLHMDILVFNKISKRYLQIYGAFPPLWNFVSQLPATSASPKLNLSPLNSSLFYIGSSFWLPGSECAYKLKVGTIVSFLHMDHSPALTVVHCVKHILSCFLVVYSKKVSVPYYSIMVRDGGLKVIKYLS